MCVGKRILKKILSRYRKTTISNAVQFYHHFSLRNEDIEKSSFTSSTVWLAIAGSVLVNVSHDSHPVRNQKRKK
jgi:hypothetical protein